MSLTLNIIDVLNGGPLLPSASGALMRDAEYHGLAGVLSDVFKRRGIAVDLAVTMRELARDIDHTAHLEQLHLIDDALSDACLRATALKGALFGERYYPRPSARVTGDIDLLVRESDLGAAAQLLAKLGYLAAAGPEEERFRREHHHLHFAHPWSLPLELHFHAYRGFGGTLRSEPLIDRSVAFRNFRALRVLAAEDELVYLATHGAAHKFGRLSWMFDIRLLVDAVDDVTLAAAVERARGLGFARPLALAADLLRDLFGVERARLLGSLGPLRGRVAHGLLGEPTRPILRAVSRLMYTTALCPDARTSATWVGGELLRRARLLRA